METMLLMTLISTNILTGGLLVLSLFLDFQGIANMLRLKIQKGTGMAIIFGKDGKLYFHVTKFSGKKTETEQIDVGGLPYNLNRKKIRYHKSHPVLVFDEGVSEPLDVQSGELSYGKVTPELLSQMIVLARQSGKMPQGEDRNAKIMFFATIGSAILSAVAVYFLFNMGSNFESLEQIGRATLEAIKTISVGA